MHYWNLFFLQTSLIFWQRQNSCKNFPKNSENGSKSRIVWQAEHKCHSFSELSFNFTHPIKNMQTSLWHIPFYFTILCNFFYAFAMFSERFANLINKISCWYVSFCIQFYDFLNAIKLYIWSYGFVVLFKANLKWIFEVLMEEREVYELISIF